MRTARRANHGFLPVSDKSTLILLVTNVGLTPSHLMSMFKDMAHVTLRAHPIPLIRRGVHAVAMFS